MIVLLRMWLSASGAKPYTMLVTMMLMMVLAMILKY